jgi:hypothetical protein
LRQTYLGQNNRGFDPRDYGYDSRIDGSARDIYEGYDVSDRLPAPAGQDDFVDDYRPLDPNGTIQDNGTWNGGTRNDGRPRTNGGGRNGGNWNNDNWNGGRTTNGLNVGDDYAQRISIPEGAVVPIRIDQQISSATARVGDRVSASIESQRMGDSEFPAGTRILGTVVEARPRQGDNPGVLDFDFRTAQLPSGEQVPLRAQLIALDDKGVQPRNGRLIASRANSSSSNDRTKIIGIGAVAGFAIGRILGKDGVLPSVLGALGGYLYSQKNNKSQVREAVVPQNARMGLRLDDAISYNDRTYYASRAQYLQRN